MGSKSKVRKCLKEKHVCIKTNNKQWSVVKKKLLIKYTYMTLYKEGQYGSIGTIYSQSSLLYQ